MTEPQGSILPIYFVADHSGSMGDLIDDLNQSIAELLETMRFESFAASKVRFTIIGFNEGSGVVLPMCDLRYVQEAQVPQFEAYGCTSFAAVFDLLTQQIPQDINALKAEGYRVFRPAVFLMTDGVPYPEKEHVWRSSLGALNSIPAHPTMLTLGFGDADQAVLAAVSPRHAYVHNGEGSAADALKSLITSLTNSIIQSGNAMAAAGATPHLEFEPPSNFIHIDIDQV